jgi:hypothetical protein
MASRRNLDTAFFAFGSAMRTSENFPDCQELSFPDDGVLFFLAALEFVVKGDNVSHGLPVATA